MDTEHPDYLFNDYVYLDNIINYTINISNDYNYIDIETISVEIYADDNTITDLTDNEIIIFNIDALRDRKYRIKEITMCSGTYDAAMMVTIEAVRIYGE